MLEGNPKHLVAKLANEILEIETSEPNEIIHSLNDLLGPALQEFETLFFRLDKTDEKNLSDLISKLKEKFTSKLKRVIVRQPNLNDVFLWVNFK